jgi:hypothetical protein
MRWVGRLAGGEGRLPRAADADLADAPLDIVFRLAEMGIPRDVSPASLAAATMAATFVAALEDTLFRRDTRWLEMSEPEVTECE